MANNQPTAKSSRISDLFKLPPLVSSTKVVEERLGALLDFAKSRRPQEITKEAAETIKESTAPMSKYAAKQAKKRAAETTQVGVDESNIETISLDGVQVFSILGESFTISTENAVQNALRIMELQSKGEVNSADLDFANTLLPVFLLSSVRARKNASYAASFYSGPSNWPVPDVFPGIVPGIGGTGAGKTEYLRKGAGLDVLIRCSEPLESVDVSGIAIRATSIDQAFTLAISFALAGQRVAIDSLRKLVYSGASGAGTMEGGISGGLYDALTTLSEVVADFGVTIIVTVNPMIAGDKLELLYKNVASSTAGALLIENGQARERTFRLVSGRFFKSGPDADNGEVREGGMSVYVNTNRLNASPDAGTLAQTLQTGLVDADDAQETPSRQMPIANF